MEGSSKEWKKVNKILIISEQGEEWVFAMKHSKPGMQAKKP